MNGATAIRLRISKAGIWLTGVAVLFAALAKALDLPSFRGQILQYDLLPREAAAPTAVAVILLEALLGLACLQLFQTRRALWGLLSLVITFSVATWIRFEALQGTDCRCFGTLLPGGPESVLLRNAVLATCIASLIVLTRNSPATQSAGWRRSGWGLAAVLVAIALTRSFAAGPGLEAESRQEDHVRIFLSATCKSCRNSVGQVGQLASNYRAAPLQIFIAADRQKQIDEFLQGVELEGGYVPLTISQLAKQVEQVPTVQYLQQGRVLKEWVGEIPALGELQSIALWQGNLPVQAAAKK